MLFISFIMLFAFQATASMSSTFLEMAKNNPAAFVDLVDMADPGSIQAIIVIVKGMLIDLEKRKDAEVDAVNASAVKLATSALDDEKKKKECEIIGVDLEEKKKAKNTAEGAFQTAKKLQDERKPILDNELETLNTVLSKVQSLLTSSETKSRRLLALDDEIIPSIVEDPESFLETLDGANPEKVNQVIALIKLLISQAQSEKDVIINDHDNKLDAQRKAQTELAAVVKASNQCQAQSAQTGTVAKEAKAAHEEVKKGYQDFKKHYMREKQTVEEIIAILEGMLKE